ncbi:MAG: MFS transporter [Verrucomicrobium sp.]|nr:MFS transporter [Verrucomicrobium sp.]
MNDSLSARTMNPVNRARWAASTLFLVDGMTFGTWAALIPALQHKLDLSVKELSGVLAGLVVGALISMPLAGRLIARKGSHAVAAFGSFAFPAGLVLLALAPNFYCLVAAAIVFGACKGMLDVSINAQGITVERAAGKPIFSSFQAFWSFGGLTSAFLLSVALHHGASATMLLGTMPALLMLMAFSTRGKLLADPPAPVAAKAKESRTLSLPNKTLLELGGLAFLALFSEGVLLDWSAVYAHSVVGVSLVGAPVAFAVFSLSMASGRGAGDWLLHRFGAVRTMRWSGCVIALGMLLAVSWHAWAATLVGFALVGCGVANLVPIIFGAAARAHEEGPGPGVATVTTIGYTGFLSGPPLIGMLAAWAGLPAAFCVVILFGLTLATAGVATIRPARRKVACAPSREGAEPPCPV